MSGLRAGLTLLLLSAWSAACASQPQPRHDAAFHVRHLPPADRDVFEALLTIGGLELTHPTCQDVGRDKSDTTVGAYLSGFLIEMDKATGGNYLAIEHVSESAESWIVRALLRHSEGDDRWSWGVEFGISKRDGAVDPRSLRCIGAG